MMDDNRPDTSTRETERRMALRWKVVQALGAVLVALGLFIDWSPTHDASVPDTASFLIVLGALLSVAGLLVAWRRE